MKANYYNCICIALLFLVISKIANVLTPIHHICISINGYFHKLNSTVSPLCGINIIFPEARSKDIFGIGKNRYIY